MKIIIIFVLASILFNMSCSNRSHYKYIVKNHLYDQMDPCISYFVIFNLNGDTLNEYLMPIGDIYFELSELDYSKREIINQLKKEELLSSLQDFDYDFYSYNYSLSKFIDSLNLLSTNEILEKFFDKKTRLRSEEISVQKRYDIIYILTKRKEYVYIFYAGENNTKHLINVFYGKLKFRRHDKMFKPINEFIK